MMLSTALALLSVLPAAFAGQVPIVEGVLGGVPTNTRAEGFVSTKAKLSSNANKAGTLRVTENSGVCETTSGVYQASGYGDLTTTESIFFWFFEAREDPDDAPLAIWLNGGPGSSSMIGLFQENGPCRIQNDTKTVKLNPNSWNNKVNMLYIDQPVGVGFSYGDTTVGTSQEAASDVWKFLQIFFADSKFSKYATNDFAIWTESYGGHYGPTFAAYFLDQNKAIANGSIKATPINIKTLAIGNGLTDPLSQYPGYIAYSGSNPYHALVSSSTIKTANTSYYKSNGCQAKIEACYAGGSTATCSAAQSYCNNNILSPLVGNYDVYYVPSLNPDAYPPDLSTYLGSAALRKKIGAESDWQETNDDVYSNFAATGDWMRNSRLDLQTVIDAGVRTIIYDGDADYILNYKGVEAMVAALETKFSSEFAKQAFTNFTVGGQTAGIFKNAGTFSYIRVYGAGHEVPAYKYGKLAYGQAALQMFSQIMSNQSLSAT